MFGRSGTFSRTDAIGNALVVGAVLLVAWLQRSWPDLVVAAIIAGLFLQSYGDWEELPHRTGCTLGVVEIRRLPGTSSKASVGERHAPMVGLAENVCTAC